MAATLPASDYDKNQMHRSDPMGRPPAARGDVLRALAAAPHTIVLLE